MATSVTSRIFLGTGIVIDECIVEIQNGEMNIRFELRFPDAASMVRINTSPASLKHIPLDEIGEPQATGRFFSGIMQRASAVVGLASAGFAKVRVIFAQIDRQWPLSLTAFPARFANWP